MDRRVAGGGHDGAAEGGAGTRREISRLPSLRRPGPGRGPSADRRQARTRPGSARAAIYDELSEEHRRRDAPLARGLRSGQGVFRGVRCRAPGRPSARRPQALARRLAVDPDSSRPLQGHRRQVPAVPLRHVGSGTVERIPRTLRVCAGARLAAQRTLLRHRRVRPAWRVRRAGVREDAAAHASRFGQFHAGPGRMGNATTRRLGRLADARSAAGRGSGFLRRPDRIAGTAAPGKGAGGRPYPAARCRPGLHADRRADAIASGA